MPLRFRSSRTCSTHGREDLSGRPRRRKFPAPPCRRGRLHPFWPLRAQIPGDSGAHAGKRLHSCHRPRSRRATLGGAYRRHALPRRRRASRPLGGVHSAATRRNALRQFAYQAPNTAGRGRGLSGAWSGLALRPQHQQRAELHYRPAAAAQLRAAGARPRRLRPHAHDGSSRAARLFCARRGNQPQRRCRAQRTCSAAVAVMR